MKERNRDVVLERDGEPQTGPWRPSEREVTEEVIPPDEFCRLAVSARLLWRADEAARGLRGLFDPVLKKRFVAYEHELRLFFARQEPTTHQS